ncbi:MAG TPA: acetyl-CoA acetyltransferase, partial [Solirubrobacteraceae bacterium]|nr:acetyl-CoA acetyltransferase [Solirubrobacteraceae bacterium]
MPSNGIRDKVAIVGMGCTKFGEHWDRSIDDLLIDAVNECVDSVPGFERETVDAYWLGTMGSGTSGLTLSRPLKIDYKPVTRVENYCATGSEAFRNACYAVASGAYDCVMAVGGEKLKDSGYSGLVVPPPSSDGTQSEPTAPAMFSLLAPAYVKKYGISDEQLKEVMTRIAWKNHRNGALNERAQFRTEVSKETIARSPLVAGSLGIYDCSGVSDGAAAALIV